MQNKKDPAEAAQYHEAAVIYNNDYAEFAFAKAEEYDHPVMKKWSTSIAKQHQFHARRHERALAKLKNASSGIPEDLTGGSLEDLVVEAQEAVRQDSDENLGEAVPSFEIQEDELVDGNVGVGTDEGVNA